MFIIYLRRGKDQPITHVQIQSDNDIFFLVGREFSTLTDLIHVCDFKNCVSFPSKTLFIIPWKRVDQGGVKIYVRFSTLWKIRASCVNRTVESSS